MYGRCWSPMAICRLFRGDPGRESFRWTWECPVSRSPECVPAGAGCDRLPGVRSGSDPRLTRSPGQADSFEHVLEAGVVADGIPGGSRAQPHQIICHPLLDHSLEALEDDLLLAEIAPCCLDGSPRNVQLQQMTPSLLPASCKNQNQRQILPVCARARTADRPCALRVQRLLVSTGVCQRQRTEVPGEVRLRIHVDGLGHECGRCVVMPRLIEHPAQNAERVGIDGVQFIGAVGQPHRFTRLPAREGENGAEAQAPAVIRIELRGTYRLTVPFLPLPIEDGGGKARYRMGIAQSRIDLERRVRRFPRFAQRLVVRLLIPEPSERLYLGNQRVRLGESRIALNCAPNHPERLLHLAHCRAMRMECLSRLEVQLVRLRVV